MAKIEKRIVYKAGITRSPSDFLCGDGELAECINLTTDNEELKVVMQPEEFMTGLTGTQKLIAVHKFSGDERFIISDSNSIKWGAKNDNGEFVTAKDDQEQDIVLFTASGTATTQVIGKFLIFSDEAGLHYFLWGDGLYKDFGNAIPEPDIQFFLRNATPKTLIKPTAGCITDDSGQSDPHVVVGKEDEYDNLIIGMYESCKNAIEENNGFVNPFFVRYAVRLYNDTYTLLSAPVLLIPCINKNHAGVYYNNNDTLQLTVCACSLQIQCNYDYTEWSDIIKGVTVFITNGVELNDFTEAHQQIFSPDFNDGIFADASNICKYRLRNNPRSGYRCLKRNMSVEEDLASTAVFYKLCDLDVKWNTSDYDLPMKSHVVRNITTQRQLGNDFYSHCNLIPHFIQAYNGRLNIGRVNRDFYDGFYFFSPYNSDNNGTVIYSDYQFYVTIRTDKGNIVVKRTKNTSHKQGLFFFYPDPRALHVAIKKGSTWILDADLTEHPFLNGAYYMHHLLDDEYVETPVATPDPKYITPTTPKPVEILDNQVMQSEVNNPFVFTYKGYKTVGTGTILALSTLTTSLSQGQFGKFPVIVFTNEGIWAMQVNGEGYLEPAQPISRDVCINANGILETDGAVFFVSKKGLMLIVGNSTENIIVKCVTEQMKGAAFNTYSIGTDDPIGTDTEWETIIRDCADSRGFLEYIRDESCFLAYDYIESRILIINPLYWYCYVFNMKDESVSKLILSEVFTGAVKSYPDYLLQGNSSRKVFSLYSAKDETEVIGRHPAFLMTRPMKLSGPTGVSSLRELANVGYWDKANGSAVKTEVYVSDNLFNWYKAESRFGAAAKYYRIALFIKMKTTERLSGTIIMEQERRSDNVRM